jgi:hypothetical protein
MFILVPSAEAEAEVEDTNIVVIVGAVAATVVMDLVEMSLDFMVI